MFSSNIKLLMKQKNKSIESIMEETHLDWHTIVNARKASKIGACKLRTLRKIAESLEVSFCDLFEED
jgi:DNA-binding Xre family transcriptional regulator